MASVQLKVDGVIAAYPCVGASNTDRYEKNSVTGLMDEDSDAYRAIKAAYDAVKEEAGFEYIKPDKQCLRPGDDHLDKSGNPRPGHAGKMALSTSTKNPLPPRAIMGRGGPGDEVNPNTITSGDEVNLLVQVWSWEHKSTPMINCELLAIQWVAKGEALQEGGDGVSEAALGAFDKLPDLEVTPIDAEGDYEI